MNKMNEHIYCYMYYLLARSVKLVLLACQLKIIIRIVLQLQHNN